MGRSCASPKWSRSALGLLPSDTFFRRAGCYGFQIDGRGFSETITFRVWLDRKTRS
jgi:hypothetical protein